MNTETPLIKSEPKVMVMKASECSKVTVRKGIMCLLVTRATQTVGRVGARSNNILRTYERPEVIQTFPDYLVQDLKKKGEKNSWRGGQSK